MAFQLTSSVPATANQDSLKKHCDTSLEKLLQRQDLGFFQLPQREQNWRLVNELAQQLRQKHQEMVLVGIGGSALGPRVLLDLFESPVGKQKVFLCDNVDPLEFQKLFMQLKNPEQACWVFISKSGATIETLTSLDFIFQKLGPALYKNSVIISEPRENPLTKWGHEHSIPQLEIPLDVGGRFSVLTAVGLLPAAFLGVDIGKIRSGAITALAMKNEISQVMMEALQSFKREEWISHFWFYSSGLKNFGLWLQQLWAESLAKSVDRKKNKPSRVSTPVSQVGACDQHSVLQQVMEGSRDKWVFFTRVQELENSGDKLLASQTPVNNILQGRTLGQLLSAEAAATEEALIRQGVSTMRLMIPDLGPETIGSMFMFWQLVVAGLGEALDINAFDQPGVELGKVLAKEKLMKSN